MSELPAEAPAPRDVSRVLAEIATLMELHGEEPFRARAFASAARALEGSDADLFALAQAGRLTTLRGVGQGIAAVIEELVLTGRCTPHEELTTRTPPGLFDLMRIPGLGTKRIRTLYSELEIDSLDSLEAAARAGRISALSGFGAKTEKKLLEGVAFARANQRRRRYPDALEVAVRLVEWLRGRTEVAAAEIVGPLRRRLEVVDGIDLLVACEDAEPVQKAFLRLNGIREEGRDEEGGVLTCLTDGLAVRLRCVAPEHFVVGVVWDTGSDAHVSQLVERARERGLHLDSLGLWRDGQPVALADEEALYRTLDLAYLAPELREGLGEVQRAAEGTLPRLIEVDDLRGTFHCHTTYSDGKATLPEMAEAARALGWQYLGLGDHSRSAAYAGGLSIDRVRAQHAEIDAWNSERGGDAFRLFKGIESDILPDGSLDFPDEVLESFDYVVGSVHSSFGMSEEEMTQRVLRAVRHPSLTILGHPTGRLLLRREGYAIDLHRVIDAAAEAGVVIEINANPHRLDLDWRLVGRAAERGVLIAINPDAHATDGLEDVAFGINMARKAGLEPRQVLNCWTLDEVAAYFAERKQKS